MSKRSRKERREHQARQALESQDPAFFEKLAATNPEGAARQLAGVFGGPRADLPAQLDALAARLCGQLRRSHKLAAAQQLAAAAADRAPRIRLELALTEIALGNDDAAERAASSDPVVASIVAPLLAAARAARPDGAHGSAPTETSSKKRGRPAGPARPPAVTALHAAAAAVGHAVRGDKKAAREALRRIPKERGEAVLAPQIAATLSMDGSAPPHRARADVELLCRSPAFTQTEAARESLMEAIATWSPNLTAIAGARLGMNVQKIRAIQARVAPPPRPGRARSASPEDAARELARAAGADAFAPEHRGAAAIFEGFAWLAEDPKRADRAFDRAVALGGDLVEALRGKMLAASPHKGQVCADCGMIHGDGGAPREAAGAADRFARAVRRLPAGAPFAAMASLLAARHWHEEGEERAALASVQVAREACGKALGKLLDVQEARIVAGRDPTRAAALLDRSIEEDPGDPELWNARLEVARASPNRKAEEDLILRAATATGDPRFAGKARTIRIQRGEARPFEGMSPGVTTAGALAAEAVPFVLGNPAAPLPAVARACREALAPEGRLAFDVALIAALLDAKRPAEVAARLGAAIDERWASPPALAKLAAATWLFGLEDTLVSEVRRRAHQPGAGPALDALFGAALAAEAPETARQILTMSSASWTRAQVKEARSALQRAEDEGMRPRFGRAAGPRRPPTSRYPAPDVIGREVDGALLPEYVIQAEDDDDDLFGLEGPAELDDELPGLDDIDDLLEVVFEMMRLSPALLDRLPAAKKRQILEAMQTIVRGVPTPAKLAELKRATQKILGSTT